jgi:hypothetical protein
MEGSLTQTVGVTTSPDRPVPPQLDSAVVVRVEEARCYLAVDESVVVADYSPQFPSPRLERVSPGNRVAVATAPDGRTVALWRWYDAVVIETEGEFVRLWEPAHGEVLATPRDPGVPFVPGTRAYLSAGLPGADWWVAGPVDGSRPASVELDEVQSLYTQYGLWESALRQEPAGDRPE